MKIASITPIYNAELFVRPHFDMLKDLDINIVLNGLVPFTDYVENGVYKTERDNTIQILKEEYPHVHIYDHSINHLGGEIFNLGMKYAKELGADVIIKLDPDMFLLKQDWERLLKVIRDGNYEQLVLDFKKCTIVYKSDWNNFPNLDFSHGVYCDVFEGVGNDALVVKIDKKFIEKDNMVGVDGAYDIINWDNFYIHHFSGFKPNCDEQEIIRISTLPKFTGWIECPDEIKEKLS